MKIAIINGICKKHDAVSDTVLAMITAFPERLGAQCRLFAYACDYDTIDFVKVANSGQVLTDRFFLDADLIVYHFGIYYGLFDAVLLGNGHAPQVVFYHNITPARFLPPTEERLINKSKQQILNATAATEVWAASTENVRHLAELGVETPAYVVPLCFKPHFSHADLAKPREGGVRVLYVGRFVESKGLTDLLRAIARAKAAGVGPFTLDLVGNTRFSDGKYIARVQRMIVELGLADTVVFSGEIDDAALDRRLLAADIFAICSYHEGFCVPLVEAMNAGAVPVAYAAGNVPTVVGGCGELVEPGNWQDFGDRLADLIRTFNGARPWPLSSLIKINGEELDGERLKARMKDHLAQFTYTGFADMIGKLAARLLS